MYRLCRALLIVAVIEFFYAFTVAIVATSPWSWIAIAVGAVITVMKRKAGALWAFGTSRWATADDLRQAGMLDAQRGLILGRTEKPSRPPMYSSLPSQAVRTSSGGA